MADEKDGRIIIYNDNEQPLLIEVDGHKAEGIIVGGRVSNGWPPLKLFFNRPVEDLQRWVEEQGGTFQWLEVRPASDLQERLAQFNRNKERDEKLPPGTS